MKIKVALMLALFMAAAINSFSQEKVHNVVFHL
jgi:hypothetical protein